MLRCCSAKFLSIRLTICLSAFAVVPSSSAYILSPLCGELVSARRWRRLQIFYRPQQTRRLTNPTRLGATRPDDRLIFTKMVHDFTFPGKLLCFRVLIKRLRSSLSPLLTNRSRPWTLLIMLIMRCDGEDYGTTSSRGRSKAQTSQRRVALSQPHWSKNK